MSSRRALVSTHLLHGASVRCWTYPATQDTGSPSRVVLAVHGFRGDHHGLARIVEALPEFTFVVPDLPGFGASTSLPAESGLKHDVPGYAAVIDSLAQQLSIPAGSILLGHSFGTLVAAAHAAGQAATSATEAGVRHWARVILVNPISEPALEGSEALLSRLAHLFYRTGAVLPQRLGTAVLRWRLVTDVMSLTMTKSRDPHLRRFVRDEHRRYFGGFTSRRALVEAFEASIGGTVADHAAKINAPTLLVAGAEDELGSPESQRTLTSVFPNASLTLIDDVGHLIHYEAAESAAALIRDFLDSAASQGTVQDA